MSRSPFQPLGPAHYAPSPEILNSANLPIVPVGVFFASRQGHTKKIVLHIAALLKAQGLDVDVIDVKDPMLFSLANYAGGIFAASVHGGNHEPEMVEFVNRHLSEIENMATAFLSVSLSEAGAERIEATPDQHAKFVRDVDQMLERFFQQTKWHPTRVKPVAGALLYSRYNFLLRLVMKQIAKKAGAETDTTRDFEYTDWKGLDHFIAEFVDTIQSATVTNPPPSSNQGVCVK